MNGTIRCFPVTSTAYADSACTERVALVDPCGAVPARVALAGPDACSPGYRVHAVGDPVPGPLYQSTGAGCLAFDTPLVARRLGVEIDPTSFVAASAVDDSPVGGVSTTWFVGEDGSRQYAGIRDATTGVPCWPEAAADGVTRCLPDGVAVNVDWGHVFGDPTCSIRAAYYYRSTCPPGAYAIVSDMIGLHVFHLGGAATPYTDSSGICSPLSVPPGYETRFLGDEIPAARFGATPYRVIGDQSWQIPVWDLPGGGIWSPSIAGGMFATASNGILRRFAAIAYTSRSYFADSTCLVRLAALPQGPGVTYAVLRDTTCPWRHRAFQLGPRWNEPIYAGTSCTLTTLPLSHEAYSLGAEIPPGVFAPVSLE